MGQNQASKIPILIASSIKPLKDTRAWEKLGISLRETNRYDLNIIGFSKKKQENLEGFKCFPSIIGKSTKWKRVLSQLRFLKTLLIVRPKILVCCTYEYLIIASVLKPFLSFKLIYDVQENYLVNLDLNPSLSPFQKSRASQIIRKSESVTGIDFYFLAEECYTLEMPEKKPNLILENKFAGKIRLKTASDYSQKKDFRFLISGTITPAFGILDGIHFFNSISEKYPGSTLRIVGHVPLKNFQKTIESEAKKNPFIRLQIDSNPVEHALILEEITKADFTLLPYQNLPAIKDKMPTKLFESLALGTPVLVSKNEKWESFLSQYQAGFGIDFSSGEDAVLTFEQILQKQFFIKSPDQEILWSSQEKEFLQVISSLH
ncbi:glycosyltransferase [Algoriphagus aestuarii]|nr:glycosyltransferase [Algoriphagus aestuarii]